MWAQGKRARCDTLTGKHVRPILQLTVRGHCAVKLAGVELRPACEHCVGRPRSGQQRYRRRDPVYLEGTQADAVYAVVDGYLRETRSTAEGREQAVRLVSPGGLAGLESLRGGSFQTSAEALTEAWVCRVPREEALRHLAERPAQLQAVISNLVDELSEVRETVLWLGAMSAEQRILALLEQLARREARTRFQLPMTRLELADFLGLSHSTVSRTLQQLRRDGRILIEGRWVELLAVSGSDRASR